MSLIVTPKFKYHRNSRSLANFGNTTNAWSNTHSYRTNYRDMSIKVCTYIYYNIPEIKHTHNYEFNFSL